MIIMIIIIKKKEKKKKKLTEISEASQPARLEQGQRYPQQGLEYHGRVSMPTAGSRYPQQGQLTHGRVQISWQGGRPHGRVVELFSRQGLNGIPTTGSTLW